MALGRQDLGDGERRQFFRWIFNIFDFKADASQGLDNDVKTDIRLEMLLKLGEGEFHAPTPPERVGTSSARKP
jgi:hypothetical protein